MPAGKLIPVRIGDVDVYVETMPPAPLVGSEQTAFGRQRPQEGEASTRSPTSSPGPRTPS